MVPIVWYVGNERLMYPVFFESILYLFSGTVGWFLFEQDTEILFDSKGNKVEAKRLKRNVTNQ